MRKKVNDPKIETVKYLELIDQNKYVKGLKRMATLCRGLVSPPPIYTESNFLRFQISKL